MFRILTLLLSIFSALILIPSCEDNNDQDPGSVTLQFKLTYDGQPLGLFEDHTYTYPGSDLSFYLVKVNFFLSQLVLEGGSSDQRLDDTQFILFATDFDNLESAQEGIAVRMDEVEAGRYSALHFSIGVPPDLNSMEPVDFTSDHPLSQTTEYWAPWDSYIFTKVEGFIDTAGTGNFEKEMVLHTGGNENLINLSFSGNSMSEIVVEPNQNTVIDVFIDLKRYLGGEEDPYPVLEGRNNRIHRLDQMEQVQELTQNLADAFSVRLR